MYVCAWDMLAQLSLVENMEKYARRALTNREMNELRGTVAQYDFICGCTIGPGDSFLRGTLFTRLELSCGSPMEFMFYGAPRLNVQKDLCGHCAAPRATTDQELKKTYKTVLPICDKGKGHGKETLKKGKLKTAGANKSDKK